MAEEILRSRHAFGHENDVDAAIQAKKIDNYDILFLTTDDGKHKIGWIDKDGNKIILNDHDTKQVLVVEELPEVGEKEVLYIFDSKFYYWDGEKFVTPTDMVGVDEATVNQKVADAVDSVNDYTDEKVEAVSNAVEKSYEKIKYEITDTPVGTLVKYLCNEIRIMCPSNSAFEKQNVGTGGDPNCNYLTFKTYVPNDDVVGYIEQLGDKVDAEVLTDFKTDVYGRRYQPTWLAIARYDEASDVWTYYGATSTEDHYIGWDYQIDWYNADGIVIASDSIRINLSNETCHNTHEPYYMNNVIETANAYTDTKVAEILTAYEIVEF